MVALAKHHEDEIAARNETITILEEQHEEHIEAIDDWQDANQRLKDLHNAEVDRLNLTLAERNDYISGVEKTVKERDHQIGLLEMEVKSLTLWREKQNQQLMTEAQISAAKAKLLQGDNAERILEQSNELSNRR